MTSAKMVGSFSLRRNLNEPRTISNGIGWLVERWNLGFEGKRLVIHIGFSGGHEFTRLGCGQEGGKAYGPLGVTDRFY